MSVVFTIALPELATTLAAARLPALPPEAVRLAGPVIETALDYLREGVPNRSGRLAEGWFATLDTTAPAVTFENPVPYAEHVCWQGEQTPAWEGLRDTLAGLLPAAISQATLPAIRAQAAPQPPGWGPQPARVQPGPVQVRPVQVRPAAGRLQLVRGGA